MAKALGVTRGRVSQMKAKGMPIDSVEAAREWKEKNVRPRFVAEQRPVVATMSAATYDIAEARAKREHHEARLAEMRAAKEAGELLERGRVVKAAADTGAMLRQSLERLGVQLAPQFAAETDAQVIRNRIEAAIADALADCEANLRRMGEV